MNLFSPLTQETRASLKRLPHIIDKAFPLPRRFRQKLKYDVAELSALFTSNRPERGVTYLGKPNLLSAYLRYFLPWNVYRLCRLLPSLPLSLKDGDAITDLGSGPLTLVLALWICRPELRRLNLEFRCIDRTPAALDAGKKLFAALEAEVPAEDAEKGAWTIKTIRGEIRSNGTLSVQIRGKPSALVGALNVYNELFWNYSPVNKNALAGLAVQSGRLLNSLCAEDGHILTVEPGIPRSGEFISLLRMAFLEQGLDAVSPCPHRGDCPYPANNSASKGKAKWCHFAFDTIDAPEELLKLSDAAGIPKDRGVVSFILAGKRRPTAKEKNTADHGKNETARIISDAFPVGTQYGRYGCSASGAVLLLGSREQTEALCSGSLAEIKLSGRRDSKSGALTAETLPRSLQILLHP